MDTFCTAFNPSNAAPNLLETRARRFLMVTEAEGASKVRSGFVKTLRDPTSEITCRNLYNSNITFQPRFLLNMSSNVEVRFTSTDGGIGRSLTVVPWPFKFVQNPSKENERPVRTDFKYDPDLRRRLAEELLVLLIAVDEVFLKQKAPGTTISPRPQVVEEASKNNIETSAKTLWLEFSRQLKTVPHASEASTQATIIFSWTNFCRAVATKTEALAVLEENLEKVRNQGQRYFRFKGHARRCLKVGEQAP